MPISSSITIKKMLLLIIAALVVLFAVLFFVPTVRADIKLVGSGASFPFPIYSKWFKDFSGQHDGIRVDYQAKGSGGGIQDFINNTVDFAASDAAMNEEELMQADNNVVLLPMTAGAVVLAYHLEGVPSLNLPRDVYPKIFTGAISKWNDPAIAKANPGVKLPDQPVTVVVRSDSSGTSYVFTSHLAEVSSEFKKIVGAGKSPNWPKNNRLVKAPKNDGVLATIKQTNGSIGYIEYGYAKLTGWEQVASLENKSGNFVEPNAETGAAALASADFPSGTLPNSKVPDLIAWSTDPAGEQAYPIASYTWMLFYTDQDDEKAAALRKLVEYGLTEGQKSAEEMGYIPLPEPVIKRVREAVGFIQ